MFSWFARYVDNKVWQSSFSLRSIKNRNIITIRCVDIGNFTQSIENAQFTRFILAYF